MRAGGRKTLELKVIYGLRVRLLYQVLEDRTVQVVVEDIALTDLLSIDEYEEQQQTRRPSARSRWRKRGK